MSIYALDTNTLTFLLKEDETVSRNAVASTNKGNELTIPQIVDYEVQRGLLAKRMTKKLQKYLAFRQTVSVGAFGEDVWEKAACVYASLRQRGKPIDDADVLIAAFCLVKGCTLVTNNTRHFENVDGLRFVDWKETAQ